MATETPGPGSSKDRQHGADGRFVINPDTAERDAEACRLRARGLSYRRIAEVMGYAQPESARRAVSRALAATVQEPAEEVRRIELERLDDVLERALAIADRVHPSVSAGKVLDVEDDGPKLAALQTVLRIQERRARLLGLDAPQRLSVDAENLGREIGELLGELNRTHDNSDYRADDQGTNEDDG